VRADRREVFAITGPLQILTEEDQEEWRGIDRPIVRGEGHLAQVGPLADAELVQDLPRLLVALGVMVLPLIARQEIERGPPDVRRIGEGFQRGDDRVAPEEGGEPRDTRREELVLAMPRRQHPQIDERTAQDPIEEFVARLDPHPTAQYATIGGGIPGGQRTDRMGACLQRRRPIGRLVRDRDGDRVGPLGTRFEPQPEARRRPIEAHRGWIEEDRRRTTVAVRAVIAEAQEIAARLGRAQRATSAFRHPAYREDIGEVGLIGQRQLQIERRAPEIVTGHRLVQFLGQQRLDMEAEHFLVQRAIGQGEIGIGQFADAPETAIAGHQERDEQQAIEAGQRGVEIAGIVEIEPQAAIGTGGTLRRDAAGFVGQEKERSALERLRSREIALVDRELVARHGGARRVRRGGGRRIGDWFGHLRFSRHVLVRRRRRACQHGEK